MKASINGHTAIAQALLDAGADLNVKDNVRPPRPAAARPLLRAAARSPAVCAAPLLYLAVWLDRPHECQRQRVHGDRAGAAGRGGRPQRQE